MTRLRITLGIISLLLSFVGNFLPIIPGPPLSFLALILIRIADHSAFSTNFLVIMGIICVIITIIDYITPVIGTKKMGGTKRGTKGSTYGLIVGIIILPMLGIVIGPFGLIGLFGGPFLGAYIGERLYQNKNQAKHKNGTQKKLSEAENNKNKKIALKAAFGSFLGFLFGIILKIIYTIVVARSIFPEIFKIIKS